MVNVGGYEHIILTTDLMTGKEIDDVKISSLYRVKKANVADKELVRDYKIGSIPQAKTRDGGIAIWKKNTDINQGTLKVNEKEETEYYNLVVVEGNNGDSVVFPYHSEPAAVPKQSIWHIFDSRNLYKPTEEVSVKGWFRFLTTKDKEESSSSGGDNGKRDNGRWYNWEFLARRLALPDISSKKAKNCR